MTGVKMTPNDIERSILRSWVMEWSQNPEACPYNYKETIEFGHGIPPMEVQGWTQHIVRYYKHNFPTLGLDPWMVEKFQAIEKGRFILRRKITNMIGSKNSGKTHFFACIGLLLVSIDPEFSRCFVAGPYKIVADAVVWGRMCTRLNQMKNADPNLWKNLELKKSEQRIIFEGGSSEAGYIELITLDKTGKLQGVKSVDPERGWLILLCDEIAEFPSKALKDVLDNLTGNSNFLCITGCNFRNVEGMEGDLCRPEGKEYAELNVDEDFEWLSSWKSFTIRFDGHQCPNVYLKRKVYPYLLDEEVRKDMEDIHGLDGPKYLEQIRSFPNTSMSDYYVTTREKIRAGGGYDEFVWDAGERFKFVFCDPGFGGDPCKIGCFQYGRAKFQSVDGNWHTISIFCPEGPIETIKLEQNKKMDEDWMRKLAKFSGKELLTRHDGKVTMEQQIVIGCAEFLERHGVEKQHFGYDGSMRAGIVHEMVAILGSSITSLDFGGSATEREVDARGTIAKDEYSNFVTEMYFNFALTVQSGQFRGAQVVPAAVSQIVRRPWLESGASRKQIQPKQEYKKDNQGRSPDDADVLVGALEMAIRGGFRGNMRRKASSAINSLPDMIKKLSQFTIFSKTTAKPLNR